MDQNIIPSDIPALLIQLSNDLFNELNQFDPTLKLEIDQNGPQFYRTINSNNTPAIETKLLPRLTRLEARILAKLEDAIDEFDLATCPPRLDSNATSLVQYHDLLKSKDHTRISIYFEIGRVLLDMTVHIRPRQRLTEMQNMIRRCVTTKNVKQQTTAALRIFEYFQKYPGHLMLKDIDTCFAPSSIARINERESEKLKDKIHQLLEKLTENNDEK